MVYIGKFLAIISGTATLKSREHAICSLITDRFLLDETADGGAYVRCNLRDRRNHSILCPVDFFSVISGNATLTSVSTPHFPWLYSLIFSALPLRLACLIAEDSGVTTSSLQ